MSSTVGVPRRTDVVHGGSAILRRLERRPVLMVIALALVSLGLVRLACGTIPAVSNMDEFAVLLTADTFLHHRLTNPTHPLWQSFETLHVIQTPTYAAKFPIAPAAVDAVGISLGNPIWGTWLSTVMAAVAVFWMFSAWMPRRWAWLGALVAVLNPVVLFWGRTYLACGLGLAGAALAIGGGRRVIRRGGWWNGAVLACGLGILANTRPLEGAILAVLLACWLVLRTRPALLFQSLRGAVPIGLAILAFTAYYNWRVTGHPLVLPYTAHHQQYDMSPTFFFQSAPPAPHYNDAHLRQFHRWEFACWAGQQGGIPWDVMYLKMLRLGTFLTTPCGLLLLAVPLAWRFRQVRYALVGLGVMAAVMVTGIWLNLNYTSPLSAVFFLVQVGCMRSVAQVRPRSFPHLGRALVMIAVACSAALAIPAARQISFNDSRYGEARMEIIDRLSQRPEGSVVFVRYTPRHNIFEEWVYNGADIDSQKVIWAIDKDPQQNRAVQQYYHDRSYFLLLADDGVLMPYSGE